MGAMELAGTLCPSPVDAQQPPQRHGADLTHIFLADERRRLRLSPSTGVDFANLFRLDRQILGGVFDEGNSAAFRQRALPGAGIAAILIVACLIFYRLDV
jgi:hypothetical protein